MANRTDFEEFVNDIFEVIETKSYKSYKSVKSNMEQYFHTQWGISRAQGR